MTTNTVVPATVNPEQAVSGERRFRLIGMITVLVVFVGFGAWASLAPLSSAAIGSGVVSVENYRKTLQHLEGGIVSEIKVRDGDHVDHDQVLVVLDATQATAQLEALRADWYLALAREARLVAQRDGRQRISFPAELAGAVHDPRAADAMRVQQQTFTSRRQARDGEAALYEQQIRILQSKARGLSAQLAGREQMVRSYQAERVDFAALVDEGYAERQRLREMERNLAQSEGQRGELMSDLAGTELQISETRLKILQVDKEIQREVSKELAEVQSDLFALREKLRSLSDTVARTVMRAPVSGTVLGLGVHTIGAVIQPGGRILDIVPVAEKLVVEAQLAPNDIDQVRIGQMAEVRFPAFKMRSLPRIDGRVVSVSADRLVDEQDGQKMPYYLGRVEISDEGLRALTAAKLDLLPGMPVEVLVHTGDRTLLQYLLVPLSDIAARALKED